MTTTKKSPVRVFLYQPTHSRLLIQAGTHGLTPSTLSEMLIMDGLSRLERGDLAAIEPDPVDAATPRPSSGL